LSAQAGAKRLEFEIVVVLEGSILFKKEREASAEKKFLGQRSFVHLLMFGGWARRKRKTYSKPSTAVAFAERKYQDKKNKTMFSSLRRSKKNPCKQIAPRKTWFATFCHIQKKTASKFRKTLRIPTLVPTFFCSWAPYLKLLVGCAFPPLKK
jgi:hypothetical protein